MATAEVKAPMAAGRAASGFATADPIQHARERFERATHAVEIIVDLATVMVAAQLA